MELVHHTLLLFFASILSVDCIRFYIRSNQRKCIREELRKNELVTGEYEIHDNGQRADIIVTDLREHILFSKENAVKGRFSFVTEEYDQFEICFITKSTGAFAENREIFLDVKHGVEAKNYEDIAKAEQLKPLEVELKKLEDLAYYIVDGFDYMSLREAEMRDTNESTQDRIMYLGVFSMSCVLGLATWQVLYLRRYFKSKKLIE